MFAKILRNRTRALLEQLNHEKDVEMQKASLLEASVKALAVNEEGERSNFIAAIKGHAQFKHLPEYARALYTMAESIELVSISSVREELAKFPDLDDRVPAAVVSMFLMRNLHLVARYYADITMERLIELVQCTQQELEKLIADGDLGDMYIKIDRSAGSVVFVPEVSSESILDKWSGDMKTVVTMLEATSHLVQIEKDVHN
ncbi:26S proteasome non-ATPase regulatory subunit 12 [Carpediemonas membranifera]|uniref:26S proteasome non-ATPase regulatory subunit 12 n=1 Tax=Carpediemonas membranifera TaxID=201153 RepID=A0A8J6AX46_9EUKA|nr:26S proteasome non-ATPase regulatory subunit 12 [Carpediemonas membranifera]|eukprot:KAG9393720.1 26S proteasome non-ATPase regulatory subunit 12 [Carpediemonas membranifera]